MDKESSIPIILKKRFIDHFASKKNDAVVCVQMLVDAVAVFLPNDPDGNAKLVFSILDCLPKANRVSFVI